MKPVYTLHTASIAIAMSLASAAQAKEATPGVDSSSAPQGEEAGAYEAGAILNVLDMAETADPVLVHGLIEEGIGAVASQTFDQVGFPPSLYRGPGSSNGFVPIGSQTYHTTTVANDRATAFLAPTAVGVTSPSGVVTPMSINPNYGNIDAFYRDIIAFYGNIDAFWGTIHPFYGNIQPFYGNIQPFYGNINPFYGNIRAFWGNISTFEAERLGSLGEFGQATSVRIQIIEDYLIASNAGSTAGTVIVGTLDPIASNLRQLILIGQAQFGGAYETETGQTFYSLAREIFSRHGIDPNNGSTFAALTQDQRAQFYVDWHDTLFQYAGIDQVDHWMSTINWNPALTQIQGAGHQTIIGIVDGSFSADADLSDNIVWAGGGMTTVNGHGAAVTSLIAAEHDGSGVMGIAPEVSIATYNPFDETQTASWDTVADGIEALLNTFVGGNQTGYVSIINLSLGESGFALSQGLADVLARPEISRRHDETLYVVAAGNDGISQDVDIDWDFSTDASLILVGSVDPNSEISSFSNRPGSACLLDNGVCHSGNELYLRTVVAPGSLILVSDGNGGVTRVSGTSFAAPLVSGAVSLLHDRWPWLASYSQETAQVIFQSARDVGAPGPDEVYGWGILDVTASQSPLNFDNVAFTVHQRRGNGYRSYQLDAPSLLAQGAIPSWWETDGVFLTGFEGVGATFRDFAIPISSLTRGTSNNALGHGQQRLQDFVADRFANWVLSRGADKDGDGHVGIAQIRANSSETRGQWTMRYDAIQPRFAQDGAVRTVHNAATLTSPDQKISFTLGYGQGALSLSGGQFGMMSDHNPTTGGVNPILGLASGEFFAGAGYKLTDSTKVSLGYSAERQDWEDLDFVSDLDRNIQRQLGAREAEAMTISVDQKVSDSLSVGVQWTRLDEADALLGQQTGNDLLLGDGSVTDAMTVSASYVFGDGLAVDLSVTGGATKSGGNQILSTPSRALSSAGQVSLSKRGLANSRDVLRMSVGQPMTLEQGQLELTSDQVVDRQTGEIGLVTQTIGIETKRRYLGELVYATPVTEGSEIGFVARYVSAGDLSAKDNMLVGVNLGMRF